MSGFLVVLAAGFAGSFHCLGMCGGFACALGSAPGASPAATALRHGLYGLGRLVSYMVIGATAGSLGTLLVGHSHGAAGHAMGFFLAGELGTGQRLLAIVGGLLMVVMALQLLGLIRHRPATWIGMGATRSAGLFTAALRALLATRSPAAAIALGVANGFLPCPLVFSFAALAAASGSPQAGVLIMAAFGLGTLPAMLSMGLLGRLLAPALRRRGVRLAGAFVLVIGFVTLVRGVAPSLLHLPGATA